MMCSHVIPILYFFEIMMVSFVVIGCWRDNNTCKGGRGGGGFEGIHQYISNGWMWRLFWYSQLPVHNSGNLFQSIVCNLFCRGFSCFPYYRGVRNSKVSVRRELTVCSFLGILNSALPPPCTIHPVLSPLKPTIHSFVSETSRPPVQTNVCLFFYLHIAKFVYLFIFSFTKPVVYF